MAIYGAGYRSLEYQQTSMWTRLWAIATGEYRTMFRRRFGVILFLLCLIPALFDLVLMMLHFGILQVGPGFDEARSQMSPRLDHTTLDFYLTPLTEPQGFMVFLILTGVVSCRAIAKDRETRALEMYWTRCIEPGGYFLAKWAGSFLLLGTITVAAPLVTWVLGCLAAPDWTYLQDTGQFFPGVMVGRILFTASLTLIAVMLSAVAGTANLASILWFAMVAGLSAFRTVLLRFFRGEYAFEAVSPWHAAKRIAEWLAGFEPARDYPVGWAIASLAVIAGGLAVLAWRTLRREGVAA